MLRTEGLLCLFLQRCLGTAPRDVVNRYVMNGMCFGRDVVNRYVMNGMCFGACFCETCLGTLPKEVAIGML